MQEIVVIDLPFLTMSLLIEGNSRDTSQYAIENLLSTVILFYELNS